MFMVAETPISTLQRPFIGIDPDPLGLLSFMLHMIGPAADDIAAAFTQLMDMPYRGRPWGQVIQSLYFTSFPPVGGLRLVSATDGGAILSRLSHGGAM